MHDAVAVLLRSRDANYAHDHQAAVRDHAGDHLFVNRLGVTTRAAEPARQPVARGVADAELDAALGQLVDGFVPRGIEWVALGWLAAPVGETGRLDQGLAVLRPNRVGVAERGGAVSEDDE